MHSIKKPLAIFVISLGLYTSQAQADVSNSLEAIAKGINQLVQDAKGKWAATLQLLYEKTPDVEQTIVSNTSNLDDKSKQVNPYANLDPKNLLAINLQNLLQPANNYLLTKALAQIPGSDLTISSPSPGFFHSGKTTDSNPNNAAFNLDSLLLPDSYQNLEQNNKLINQQELAKNYLQFLYYGSKIPNDMQLDLTKLTPKDTESLLGYSGFKNYLLIMRSYVANQSLAMSNFYTMYNKRLPIPGLGKKLGLAQPDMSVKQVEHYLASRRIANSDWYYQMESASPATVMREMLYVLAEVRYELYQARQDSERTLATLSAMQLQSLQNPLQLRVAKDSAVAAANQMDINLTTANG